MESILAHNYQCYKERIKLGSLHITAEEYPFYTFIIGCFIQKVEDIEELFELVQFIWSVGQKKTLSIILVKQILILLHQQPQSIRKINSALASLEKEASFDIIRAIQSIYLNKDICLNKDASNKLKPTTSKDTIRLQAGSFDQPAFSSKSHTEELDEDLELAKRLQEQEDNAARPAKHQEEEVPCEICYVPLYESEYYLLQKCAHLFHKECLAEGFKAQIIQNKFPLLCPNEQCKKQVINSDVKQILSKQLFTKYEEHTIKSYAEMNHDSISWCPTADCGYMFFFEKEDEERFQCSLCKKEYCLNCRVQWHKDMTCKQYKISATVTEEDEKFMKFVIGKKFKQCPKCKFWVQKNQGCDHMTCKCKFQFCYKCGGIYMKCECAEAAKIEAERRQRLALQRRQKKEQRIKKAQQRKSIAMEKQTRQTRKRKK